MHTIALYFRVVGGEPDSGSPGDFICLLAPRLASDCSRNRAPFDVRLEVVTRKVGHLLLWEGGGKVSRFAEALAEPASPWVPQQSSRVGSPTSPSHTPTRFHAFLTLCDLFRDIPGSLLPRGRSVHPPFPPFGDHTGYTANGGVSLLLRSSRRNLGDLSLHTQPPLPYMVALLSSWPVS
jgi:hypothetical protein